MVSPHTTYPHRPHRPADQPLRQAHHPAKPGSRCGTFGTRPSAEGSHMCSQGSSTVLGSMQHQGACTLRNRLPGALPSSPHLPRRRSQTRGNPTLLGQDRHARLRQHHQPQPPWSLHRLLNRNRPALPSRVRCAHHWRCQGRPPKVSDHPLPMACCTSHTHWLPDHSETCTQGTLWMITE